MAAGYLPHGHPVMSAVVWVGCLVPRFRVQPQAPKKAAPAKPKAEKAAPAKKRPAVGGAGGKGSDSGSESPSHVTPAKKPKVAAAAPAAKGEHHCVAPIIKSGIPWHVGLRLPVVNACEFRSGWRHTRQGHCFQAVRGRCICCQGEICSTARKSRGKREGWCVPCVCCLRCAAFAIAVVERCGLRPPQPPPSSWSI